MKKFWIAPCCVLGMVLYAGMTYAHLIYNTPGEAVYLSATDVVQVADRNETPLKNDKVASTAVAATARGVRVKLLPTPQTAELASNGAVDEGALKTALDSWVQNCNAVLGQYERMDPGKAAKEVIAWTTYNTFAGLGAVENCLTPLLQRWAKTQYFASPDVLGVNEQKILDVLADYGLMPEIVEGSPIIMADLTALRKRINLEPPVAAHTAYVALLDTQPQILFSDRGCRHSVKRMGTWAIQWEQYLKTVPADSFYFTEGKKRYLEFATYILFSDLLNTPAFPDRNNGKMEEHWMESLEDVASNSPGSETAALITEFLKKVKDNDNKLAPSVRKAFSAKLDTLPEPSKPSTAEEKLLGQHMFSLQWIKGPMGEAVISRTKNSGLHIEARQEHKGDYVTLNGDVRIIDDKNFVVTGVLVTRVSYNAGGKPCVRSGEFTFTVTKNRKYWRLQQMDNPCEPIIDYVDVYFKGL